VPVPAARSSARRRAVHAGVLGIGLPGVPRFALTGIAPITGIGLRLPVGGPVHPGALGFLVVLLALATGGSHPRTVACGAAARRVSPPRGYASPA
jgi:hypothetical protein